MRIISGAARGRPLAAPPGRATRPTSDRTREALFSTLEALRGPLAGARVLDLYAGSGAVGLEALSRGAGYVVLVERDPRAVRTLRQNVEAVGLPGAQVQATAVDRVTEGDFDVVFADPPYAEAVDLARIAAHASPGGLVVVERSARDAPLEWPREVEALRDRRYGEGTLWYGRRGAEGEGT